MKFTDEQRRKIDSLVKKGTPMWKIADLIGNGCRWTDIQAHCWETGTMSWQGSKRIVSNGLRKMAASNCAKERQELSVKIDEQVKFLYYLGKEMRDRLVNVEKAIDKLKI
jgi:hypothetical protein